MSKKVTGLALEEGGSLPLLPSPLPRFWSERAKPVTAQGENTWDRDARIRVALHFTTEDPVSMYVWIL